MPSVLVEAFVFARFYHSNPIQGSSFDASTEAFAEVRKGIL